MKKYKKSWICCKNKFCSIDFILCKTHRIKSMLQLSLLLVFLPVLTWAQVLRTTGNIRIVATNCPKIYLNGRADFASSTVLAGSADFQATGGVINHSETNFTTCKITTFEGCQIKVYTGSWVHILMSNMEMGKIEVELIDVQGRVISTVRSESKTTPTWGRWVETTDLPATAYVLRVKINDKKYCSENIRNVEKKLPCMSLFPNPAAEDFLNIENLGVEINTDTLSYQIIDIQGRQMQTYHAQLIADQTWQIRVSQLRKGLYIIRFRECEYKFVKQ